MTELVVPLRYRPLPQQQLFRRSTATVRGFGGAMGGGKTRALCEEVFDRMLEYPGISIAVVRQKHTAIVDTTRKTFLTQVLPPEIRGRKDLIRVVKSQGEDFVEFLWCGSVVHFVGLDDPGKFFSNEYGAACFDEAHEISEEDVLTVNTRLRQRCTACALQAAAFDDPDDAPDCDHYPHDMILTFNPSTPNHWLRRWFVLGADPFDGGAIWKKAELYAKDAAFPVGSAEFFVSKATDNKYLSEKYVKQNLGGMSEMKRRRYLDGLWEHIDGDGFFDQDALSRLTLEAMESHALLVGEPVGDITGADTTKPPALVARTNGRLEVFKAPVRWHVTQAGEEIKAHRYVVAVDSSSGAGADYSGIQVIDVDELEQVAEWQGKADPDKIGEAAFLLAAVYNGAQVAPEITGGWGFAVVKKVQRLCGDWKGPAKSKPRLYTRPIIDRLSNKFTDALGWDTNVKSRANMLAILEEALRDGSVDIHGQRTLAELASFGFPERVATNEYRSPRARVGEHDDLVIALAISVAIAIRLPRTQRQRPQAPYEPQFAATGY